MLKLLVNHRLCISYEDNNLKRPLMLSKYLSTFLNVKKFNFINDF